MQQIPVLLALFLILFLPSCAAYKHSTSSYVQKPTAVTASDQNSSYSEQQDRIYERKVVASEHWLYTIVPRHRSQLHWYDLGHWITWTFFGNDDDGIFGEEEKACFRYEKPINLKLAAAWSLRNPLHNFTFYVIGTSYTQNSEVTLLKVAQGTVNSFEYKETGTTVFADKTTSFFCGLHGWKPFISLRIQYNDQKKGDFYLGWRELGNFGIKLVPYSKTTPDPS